MTGKADRKLLVPRAAFSFTVVKSASSFRLKKLSETVLGKPTGGVV